VAQKIEHLTIVREVTGSTPVRVDKFGKVAEEPQDTHTTAAYPASVS